MNKKVSILIPLYNAEKWVSSTIYSILNQSYPNIEVIIVDDGSTDNSYKIVASIKSDKIKLFKQSNKGACVARNKAFELSSGDYIVYFDADDIMYKDKIKNQMALVEKFGDDYIYSSQWISFTGKQPENFPEKTAIDKNFNSPEEWLTTSWLNRSGAVGIWLTPRELIEKAGNWDESIIMNDDGDFFFRVLMVSTGVKFTDNAYMFYRRDVRTSITRSFSDKRASDILKTYISYEKILEKRDDQIVRKALATNYAKFIYNFYNKKELTNIAWKQLKNLGVKENFNVGGKRFQFISALIGYKAALKLKSHKK